jgi:hypothetical protein
MPPHVFDSVKEAGAATETWRRDHNEERPHNGLAEYRP